MECEPSVSKQELNVSLGKLVSWKSVKDLVFSAKVELKIALHNDPFLGGLITSKSEKKQK